MPKIPNFKCCNQGCGVPPNRGVLRLRLRSPKKSANSGLRLRDSDSGCKSYRSLHKLKYFFLTCKIQPKENKFCVSKLYNIYCVMFLFKFSSTFVNFHFHQLASISTFFCVLSKHWEKRHLVSARCHKFSSVAQR